MNVRRRTAAGALSRGRVLAGFALAAVAGPLLTLALRGVHGDEALVVYALSYQLVVVGVALVGGWWPALFTAVLSGISLDFFFVEPMGTVDIADPLHVLAVALYVINGLLVSWVVDLAARQARAATLAATEAKRLAATALEAEVAVEADKVRTALLNAVGHDLRRPLAAAVASLGALRSTRLQLGESDRAELLDTAAEALDTLTSLVTNLLDVSRLQAGALGVAAVAVEAEDVALAALDELGVGPQEVRLRWPEGLGRVVADPGLLQRVLVNLLSNALRYQPGETPVVLAAERIDDEVRVSVVDRGPGVSPERRARMFQPFQRLGDTDNTTGLGLGLAVVKGFVDGMGGSVEPTETPGGGLTVTLSLPACGSPAEAAKEEAT